MLRHTFTGSNLRSVLGLDSAWTVFERFRQHRRRARNYLPALPPEESAPGHRAA
jgi:hypothetical protein